MSDSDWESGTARSLGVYLNGEGIPDPDALGQAIIDDSFLLFFNAHHEPVGFQAPATSFGSSWEIVVDTRASTAEVDARLSDTALLHSALDPASMGRAVKAGDPIELDARSTVVLRRVS
jgi:glycogen operon protein